MVLDRPSPPPTTAPPSLCPRARPFFVRVPNVQQHFYLRNTSLASGGAVRDILRQIGLGTNRNAPPLWSPFQHEPADLGATHTLLTPRLQICKAVAVRTSKSLSGDRLPNVPTKRLLSPTAGPALVEASPGLGSSTGRPRTGSGVSHRPTPCCAHSDALVSGERTVRRVDAKVRRTLRSPPCMPLVGHSNVREQAFPDAVPTSTMKMKLGNGSAVRLDCDSYRRHPFVVPAHAKGSDLEA